MEIAEYERYMEDNATTCANSLLADTGDYDDTEIDIGTPINKLKFHLSDISKSLETSIASNEGLTTHLDTLNTLGESLDLKIGPSSAQLKRSYDRLDQNVIKPYNECMDIHRTIKRIHSTNKILRGASIALELSFKIQEERKIYEKCLLINEFNSHMKRSTYLKPLKSIEVQVNKINTIKLEINKKIQTDLKNLSVYKITTTNNGGINSQIVNKANEFELEDMFKSLQVLTPELVLPISNEIFKSTLTHCIQLINKNINNAKSIPSIIMNFQSTVENLCKIENAIKKTNAWSEFEFKEATKKFWVELSINVEPKIRDVVSKGGPIGRNFKMVSVEINQAIREVVPKEDNVELIVLNAFKTQS